MPQAKASEGVRNNSHVDHRGEEVSGDLPPLKQKRRVQPSWTRRLRIRWGLLPGLHREQLDVEDQR